MNFNYAYYRYLDTIIGTDEESREINNVMKKLLNPLTKLEYTEYLELIGTTNDNCIKCTIGGQGLLIGNSAIDYTELELNPKGGEEISMYNNFFQNTLQFDYSIGHAYVPGSSLKGALKSHLNEESEALIGVLNKVNKDTLMVDLFENSYDRVVYYDSYFEPLSVGNNYALYNSDNITPHGQDGDADEYDYTATVNPLLIIKVIAGAKLRVNIHIPEKLSYKYQTEYGIDLYMDVLIPAFKEIGIGGKTNTGFGHFNLVEYKGLEC